MHGIPRAAFGLLVLAVAACGAAPSQPAKPAAPAAPAQPAAESQPAAPGQPAAPAAAAPPAASKPAAVAPLSPPVDVKMGAINITADAGVYTALERGYFADEGLQVELLPFRSGQEQIPALATNQIQFGSGSLDVSLLNAVARDINLRIVQDKVRFSDKHASGTGLAARTDLFTSGALDEPSKLKGKTIAISTVGSTTDLYIERALRLGGLTLDDATVTTVPVTDMPAALANSAVDAAWMFDPFLAITTMNDYGRLLVDAGKVVPEFYAQFLLVSEQFAEQNPEAVRRFVTAHLRGQRDFYRAFVSDEAPGDREAIIGYLMKYTPLKDRAVYDRVGFAAVEPNGHVDPAVLDGFQDWAIEKGRLPAKVDIRRLIDPQYVQYAVERLGRLPEQFR